MLKYIKHSQIDFEKWDKTILSSSFPFVFAQSYYLNSTSPQWDALIIGDYESVFPVTHKTKFGIPYLPQPPLTSQLGIYGKVNDEIEKTIYTHILSHFKLIEIELNVTNKIELPYISSKNTYIINYSQGYIFNQNTKRNISKAIEHKFYVERVNDEEILSISKTYLNPFLNNQLHLSKTTILLFDNLLRNSLINQQLYTFKVLDNHQNIRALGHFICNGKHALFLKGTNFDKSENTGSMHLLMQHAIHFFEDKSIWFDFGGGSLSEGLANFYKGFGGEAMNYSFLRVNKLPWLIKLFKK